MRSRAVAVAAAAFVLACVARAAVADDAAKGYANVRPALVKVWSFDGSGRPVESGSGIVIVSNHARSLVLTAAHVVAGAASIKIDLDRDRHDLVARVQQRGARDLAILELDRGDLPTATFASRAHAVVEGNLIAVAGFVKHDELIGIVGQEPRLLFPGTVSSRPENGAYLELENVHIEEGLSGGPVFDPDTGDVLGIVTSRTSDQRGGFADSGALVVLPFLASSAVAFHERDAVRIVARATPVARATTAPVPAIKPSPRAPAVAVAIPTPVPLRATPVAVAIVQTPPPVERPRVWEAQDTQPHRLAYYHRGCAIVLSLAVTQLAFGVPSSIDDARPASARLRLRVGRRVAPVAACQDVAESTPADAAYEAAASSYDGRHVTVRFRYVPGPDATAADAALFPSDISVDADLSASPVTAHVQLIDADWDGELDVIASRDR